MPAGSLSPWIAGSPCLCTCYRSLAPVHGTSNARHPCTQQNISEARFQPGRHDTGLVYQRMHLSCGYPLLEC